jgi:hypothetical protein
MTSSGGHTVLARLLQTLLRPRTEVISRIWARQELGAAGIRRVSIDVVLLEWRIRKQRGNPDAMMKAARIVNQHRRYSEASKLLDFWFGAEFSSDVAVYSSTSALT